MGQTRVDFRILIVDKHKLVRASLSKGLEGAERIRVVGEAKDARSTMEAIHRLQPDVVLLDFYLPDLSGLKLTERLLRFNRNIKTMILTDRVHLVLASRVLEAGAGAYLTKDTSMADLVSNIHSVMHGGKIVSSAVATQLALLHIDANQESLLNDLTNNELEIVLMLANGLTLREMAELLHLSVKTVQAYRYRIFEKLLIKNDVGLTILLAQQGLLSAEVV